MRNNLNPHLIKISGGYCEQLGDYGEGKGD